MVTELTCSNNLFKYRDWFNSRQRDLLRVIVFMRDSLVFMTDLLGFIVFELYMQAVLYADLHLDAAVHLWVLGQGVYDDVLLLHQVTQPLHHRHP